MIEQRSLMSPAPWSKRLSCASSRAKHGRSLISAAALAAACTLATACDGGHDDPNARSSAVDSVPMLPGTRNAATPSPSRGAGQFDTASDAQPRGASDALLPPVMHTAD